MEIVFRSYGALSTNRFIARWEKGKQENVHNSTFFNPYDASSECNYSRYHEADSEDESVYISQIQFPFDVKAAVILCDLT